MASRIARGKFSQLKEQAKENLAIAGQSAKPFQNSEKVSEVQKVNTTQVLADELKTSTDTASRIIQIQAKAKNEVVESTTSFVIGLACLKTSKTL